MTGVTRLYQLVIQTWLELFDEEGLIDGNSTFTSAAIEHLEFVDGNTSMAKINLLTYLLRGACIGLMLSHVGR